MVAAGRSADSVEGGNVEERSALAAPVLLPPPGAIDAVAAIERPDLIGNLAAWADSRRSTQ